MSGAAAFVLGRFPPPADGQTLATERCASFLDGAFDVRRLDTQAPGPDPLTAHPRFDLGRAVHYARLLPSTRAALRECPRAPVLWHAVSPAPLGHLRDVLTAVPAFVPGQPVAAVLHRAGFDALFTSPLAARTARRLVRRVDAFVFQSPHLAERCASVVPETKRVVIPNTVRDDAVAPGGAVAARRAEGPGAPLHVLFLSNMLPEKGYGTLAEALAVVRGRGGAVRATFAGRWPSNAARTAFEGKLRDLGLGNAAHVVGAVADVAEVRRLHLDADVFALPTTHPTETQPIAILEALGAGTPVVAVDRPALRAMITDGVEGALVPAHDVGALAAAVERLSEPAAWRAASAAASARFDAAFSPSVVGERWRALTSELAGHPTRPPMPAP